MADAEQVQSWINELQSLRWPKKRASDWYSAMPWLVGANFVPSTASNQLEMWQAETFDEKTIDRELGWAAAIGMNSMRVFLHDLLWKQDAAAFLTRIDRYLGIASKHGISTMPVFFDSCWHPFPHLGPQRPPERCTHNSCWVQSPGVQVIKDERSFDELEAYVTGVVSHFRDDRRICLWDVWNEPDNANSMVYGPRDLQERKSAVVLPLLYKTFKWVRNAKPSQPVSSGVWHQEWNPEQIQQFHRLQIEASDILTFHRYSDQPITQKYVKQLKAYGRPLICTEYMSRGSGSTFNAILPYFKKEGIGAYNWGLVVGKTQTNYPWDSWQKPYESEPPLWFHEVFQPDGQPYRTEETELIRKLTRTRRGPDNRKRPSHILSAPLNSIFPDYGYCTPLGSALPASLPAGRSTARTAVGSGAGHSAVLSGHPRRQPAQGIPTRGGIACAGGGLA